MSPDEQQRADEAWLEFMVRHGIHATKPWPQGLRAKRADFMEGYAAALADRSAS